MDKTVNLSDNTNFNSNLLNRFLWVLIGLAIVLSLNSLIRSSSFINTNFPGFLVYNNQTISQTLLKEWWDGAEPEVQFLDKILEVNNIEINNSLELYQIVRNEKVGSIIEYKIQRDQKIFKLSLPVKKFPFNSYLKIFVVQFSVGLIILITGIIVFYLKPNLISSRVTLLLCMSLSIWFIADFDYLTTYSIFYKFNPSYFAQIFTGAFLFMLAFAFPQPKRFFLKSKLIFMSPVIYCFIIFLTQYIFLNDYSIWKNIDTFIWINNLLATIVVTAVFSYDYFKSDVEVYKQRAIVALTGSLIGFLTPALLGLIFVLFNYDSISFISIPVLFFPLSLAYSIVKHKLFDIDLILQKTIVYGALTGVVASLFIVTVLGFNLVFSTKTGWQNPAFFFILSGLLVVALNPIRDKIQNIIDRAFFRKKYDYRSTVAEVSDAMTSILNVDQIASKVINTITDTMFVDPCTVLILNKETGYFVPYSSNTDKFKHDYLKFDYENKLISFFYGSKKELFREDILADDKFIGSKEELLDEFEKLDASLIIPIAFKDQLLGLLCLGKKKSGQLFNSNDLTLLKTLANQSAIAIENAFALKLVQDYANELEESNKKLKDIQSQLIHAEKMSAIGQLASGIAHEIRNPLNIIEGARFYLSSHIKEVKKDEVVNQYLEYIRNEVQRTNKLIDEILQFSKPSQAEFQKLNINNLIENVLILTRKQISDSYVNIVKDLHNNLPDVYVDSSQIWQVFINMIMNSLEAMDKDGQLNIETGISSNNGIYNNDDEYVYVIFKDDGVGIKDDDMSKIFDPFFTTKASGTGLGLSVSYKIIEAHNGRILVNSEYGKGTNFMVEIPVKDNFLN